jgi:hypothetical protein
MKTQIIQLDSYDDLISTKDKIGWGKGSRIILVWPLLGRPFGDKLELKLLLRHSRRLGGELGLVTRDAEVTANAEEVGIPVFRSLRKAQQTAWEMPDQPTFEPRESDPDRLRQLRRSVSLLASHSRHLNPIARAGLFLLGVLAFLAIAALLLPGAEIQLSPLSETQEISIEVTASTAVASYNLAGALPAESMRITVEGRDSLATSGAITIPERAASGEVVFSNLSDQEVDVPQGTVVHNEGNPVIRFVTTAGGTVPGEVGGSLTLPVTAANPGSSGNLDADSLVVIEGPLSLSLAVTNPEPTTGGSELSSAAPAESDYAQLKGQLLATLAQGALDEAAMDLIEDDIILSTQPELVEVLEESYDPNSSEQPATELALTLRATFEVVFVRGETMRQMAAAILDAQMAEGYAPQEGNLTIEQLSTPSLSADGEASWPLRAQRTVVTELPQTEVVNLVLGLRPEEASQKLSETFQLASPPQISTWPNWWPWLPSLPFRISIENGQ